MFIKFRNSIIITCFSVFISFFTCKAMDIHEENLFVPHGLAGKARLMYDYKQGDFTAVIDGESKKINRYNISGIPSNLSKDQMEGFLKFGYFSLQRTGNDYSLSANLRLLGGVYGAQKVGASEKAGQVAGGIAGAAVGAVVGGAIVGSVAGPMGVAAGAAVGAAMVYTGEALGNTQQPNAPQKNKK